MEAWWRFLRLEASGGQSGFGDVGVFWLSAPTFLRSLIIVLSFAGTGLVSE